MDGGCAEIKTNQNETLNLRPREYYFTCFNTIETKGALLCWNFRLSEYNAKIIGLHSTLSSRLVQDLIRSENLK